MKRDEKIRFFAIAFTIPPFYIIGSFPEPGPESQDTAGLPTEAGRLTAG